jgi:hypothetical protein
MRLLLFSFLFGLFPVLMARDVALPNNRARQNAIILVAPDTAASVARSEPVEIRILAPAVRQGRYDGVRR